MCFSAPASLIAGGVLTAVGVATLRKTTTKAELPLASFSLLFGIQQLVEGVVWLSFGVPSLNWAASHLYVLFSHILWPTLVPYAVLRIEPDFNRRSALKGLFVIGVFVSLYFLVMLVREPMTCAIVNHSISYHLANYHVILTTGLYLVATCLSLLISSHRRLNFVGFALSLAALITHLVFASTFVSTWCFFGAILSILIYWYFSDPKHPNFKLPRLKRRLSS